MMRLLAVLLCGLWVGIAPAGDWPQFLGPRRDGSADLKVTPWTKPPTVLWTNEGIGDGHSSPVVANGKVYLFFQPKGKNADALACFDAKTGKKLWEQSYERAEFNPPFGKGPRSTPSVAGKQVVTFGNTGILAVWDAESGTLLKQIDTFREFHAKNLFFGVSCSPLVVGDTAYVNVGGKGASIVAVNIDTGATVWKAESDPASYASGVLLQTKEFSGLVFLTGANVLGLSTSGATMWKQPFKDLLNESSTTPIHHDGILIAASVTAGAIGLKFEREGNEVRVTKAWTNPKLTCYFSTPTVLDDKHLAVVTGTASLRNATVTLHCVEAASGKIVWSKEKVGKYHASVTRLADGKLLMLDDLGTLVLLEPSPQAYQELARAKICGDTWAHPAFADGVLFIRDAKQLLAVKLD